MTVPMALLDFLPVLLFGSAWVILYRDLKNKLNLCDRILLPLGAVMVFLAGFLKATWKMQKALGVPAVELFNKMMFPTQSVGFVLLAVGMLSLMYGKRKSAARSLTMVWVMCNVLGALGMLSGLVWVAKRMKVKPAIPLFILTFVLLMMMGYLSSHDFAQASANWIAQSINTLGEGLLLVGSILLHKAGLADKNALAKQA
jgi:hypothetical protein